MATKKRKKVVKVTEAHKKRVRTHLERLEAAIKKLRDTVTAINFVGAGPKAGRRKR